MARTVSITSASSCTGNCEWVRSFQIRRADQKGLLTRATEGLFAKGKGKGEVLPVKLTGTYDDPSYGLDK